MSNRHQRYYDFIFEEVKFFVDNLGYLIYNFGMKKLLTCLFVLGILNCSCAYCGILPTKVKEQTQNIELDETSQQARVLYAQNDIDGALKILKEKSESERSAEDWLMIGNILQDKEKIDEAIYMYNKAISADPKYYKAHYNLGYIYLIQDKPNMALSEFKLAVKYKPDFSYGYYNIGCAYLKLKKYSNARYNFFKALDLRANEPNVYYNLAYTFKMLNKEKQANSYLEIYNKMMEDHEL